MRSELVTDDLGEPVTLAEFLAFARIDSTNAAGGDLLAPLLRGARKRVERDTGVVMLTQTWVDTADRWPSRPSPDRRYGLYDPYAGGLSSGNTGWWDGVRDGPVSALRAASGIWELVKRPFGAVTKLEVADASATFTTIAASNYYVEKSGDGVGRVGILPGGIIPTPQIQNGGIKITYTAGYGATPDTVDNDLKVAIMMLAAHWHENREPVTDGRFGSTPNHYDSIIEARRGMRL